jgi:hypothetical protein
MNEGTAGEGGGPALFHVELKQFPHVARAFNLSREELQARILGPFVRDQVVELQDRRWAPERVKLMIYEGRRLRPDEIGLGRGWNNVVRNSTDVTERLLAEARAEANPPLDALKQAILDRCAAGPVGFEQLEELGGGGALDAAVWQLVREGRLLLIAASAV